MADNYVLLNYNAMKKIMAAAKAIVDLPNIHSDFLLLVKVL